VAPVLTRLYFLLIQCDTTAGHVGLGFRHGNVAFGTASDGIFVEDVLGTQREVPRRVGLPVRSGGGAGQERPNLSRGSAAGQQASPGLGGGGHGTRLRRHGALVLLISELRQVGHLRENFVGHLRLRRLWNSKIIGI
jgi:hypothetical protein